MTIKPVDKTDYPKLITLWEASVRATHDFLKDEDIVFLRPLILERYFDAVELRCAKDNQGNILGFCGVAKNNLEMLFVSPESRGQGVGSALCRHAIENMHVTTVDVNEQNTQALGFYKHIGFTVTGRSPVDGQGKPFPLLHMQLN
ncbi:acetyltransferase [Pseudodesulfovibrio sediminis]|uniref:GCN5 family N-acetyltransferase n=1 Tax=Pseudodesulfovibrio sediminis TaxID=2810563 RepID=A0ABM7P3A2_9BACT|nr:acetyltransferase [Pseudodesulfovibrio sediminis]BCS87295.1 GCN5 family N-acetyltransferase [Pseudodesulfovibrio sediminis]